MWAGTMEGVMEMMSASVTTYTHPEEQNVEGMESV